MSVTSLSPVYIGIDEVGRGAWAGPLAVGAASGDPEAAAQVLRRRRRGEGFYDSKALSAQRREVALSQLREVGISFAVGFASASEIDTVGLTQALAMAARRGLQELASRLAEPRDEQLLLLDGKTNYLEGARVETIVGGDRVHPLIAAASIAAKVARDGLMVDLDFELPYWDLSSSKGYGSRRHRCGLVWLGPSVEHRRSFRPVQELTAPASGRFFSPRSAKLDLLK